MTKAKRIPPEARTKQLLAIALDLARKGGLASLTRERIADEAGVAAGLVSLRLGTMPDMRRAVMRAAIADEVLEVVAEGLAERPPNKHAAGAPIELRRRAAALMAGV